MALYPVPHPAVTSMVCIKTIGAAYHRLYQSPDRLIVTGKAWYPFLVPGI